MSGLGGTYPNGARVQCPICNTWWTIPAYSDGIECNCHLICPDGEVQDDCLVTTYNWSGQWGAPAEAHNDAENYSNDRRHATGFCSIHSNYVHRQLVYIEVNWSEYFKTALPRSQRVDRSG